MLDSYSRQFLLQTTNIKALSLVHLFNLYELKTIIIKNIFAFHQFGFRLSPEKELDLFFHFHFISDNTAYTHTRKNKICNDVYQYGM